MMKPPTKAQRRELDAAALEVLHGVHLAERMLAYAADPANYRALYRRHPELRAALIEAEDAIGRLYQAAGRAWGSRHEGRR